MPRTGKTATPLALPRPCACPDWLPLLVCNPLACTSVACLRFFVHSLAPDLALGYVTAFQNEGGARQVSKREQKAEQGTAVLGDGSRAGQAAAADSAGMGRAGTPATQAAAALAVAAMKKGQRSKAGVGSKGNGETEVQVLCMQRRTKDAAACRCSPAAMLCCSGTVPHHHGCLLVTIHAMSMFWRLEGAPSGGKLDRVPCWRLACYACCACCASSPCCCAAAAQVSQVKVCSGTGWSSCML